MYVRRASAAKDTFCGPAARGITLSISTSTFLESNTLHEIDLTGLRSSTIFIAHMDAVSIELLPYLLMPRQSHCQSDLLAFEFGARDIGCVVMSESERKWQEREVDSNRQERAPDPVTPQECVGRSDRV